jgi:hypothetical protein
MKVYTFELFKTKLVIFSVFLRRWVGPIGKKRKNLLPHQLFNLISGIQKLYK